jgi:alpha-1,6-mannosyltransferase
MSNKNGRFLLLSLLSLAAYIGLLYFTRRTDFAQLILLFALLFAAYAIFIQKTWAESHFQSAIGAAFVFRLALLFACPNLSDDYHRFVWDGRLLVHGINPYLVLPTDFIQSPQAAGAGLTEELYQQLNSPHYYTVYPPVNQAIFAVAAGLFPWSLLGSVVVMRLFILLA